MKEKKEIINISNDFLQARKNNSLNINGLRSFSIALMNVNKEYRQYGTDSAGIKGHFYVSEIDNNTWFKIFGGKKENISKDIKRGLENILSTSMQVGKNSDTAKYYPIFLEVDLGEKKVVFNPTIFNPDVIDLDQVKNFSKIILPRLSDSYQKDKKLSKNAISLELLLQSHKDKYRVNIYRLKEQLGLIDYDSKTNKIISYKYKEFGYFNKNLKIWVNEINEINDDNKIIHNLTYKVIYDQNKYAKDIIFEYEKIARTNNREMREIDSFEDFVGNKKDNRKDVEQIEELLDKYKNEI